MDWGNVSGAELLVALKEARSLPRFEPLLRLSRRRTGGLESEAAPSERFAHRSPDAAARPAADAAAQSSSHASRRQRLGPSGSRGSSATVLRPTAAAIGRPTHSLAAYYYRVNYFALVVLSFVVAFLRNPLAFFAVGFAALTTLCLNDSFAHTVRCSRSRSRRLLSTTALTCLFTLSSERVVRITRRIHPPLSAMLRNPTTTSCAHAPPSVGSI